MVKNRSDSDSIDNTIPTVVRIAMVDDRINSANTTCSTRLRARNSGLVARIARIRPPIDKTKVRMVRPTAPTRDISR